jgi:hypothetical protein
MKSLHRSTAMLTLACALTLAAGPAASATPPAAVRISPGAVQSLAGFIQKTRADVQFAAQASRSRPDIERLRTVERKLNLLDHSIRQNPPVYRGGQVKAVVIALDRAIDDNTLLANSQLALRNDAGAFQSFYREHR